MGYSVVDLGPMQPQGISNRGDVILTGSGLNPPNFVRLVDGTLITLPSEIIDVRAINNERVVLARVQGSTGREYALYNLETNTTEPIAIPGYPAIGPLALNNSGDVAGTAAKGWSVLDDQRGFIFNHNTQAVTWVLPTLPSQPPGSTAFLELKDINDIGHAIGVQGWVLGYDQLEVPVFYDGANLRAVANPTFLSNGIRITNDDKLWVWFFGRGGPEVQAIYDATTDTLTPFSNGQMLDLNANGQILFERELNYYLQSGGFITAVSDLFPSGSGWSLDFAIQMNDSGAIVGWGELHTNAGSSAGHGFLLSPPPLRIPRGKRDDIIAIILWGVINCGPGVAIIGGHLVRIPPHGPLNELMAALPEALRNELTPLIEDAHFREPADVRDFRRRVTSVISSYSRRTFGRS
ncbi:hypothetical protein AB7G19_26220 [Bradyrhizobium sp. 215_C5_N1_1]|uniref:hypothetical protein n=1 Tax=unclassified Bradyrhizobium TaxID=2631580 RepID=UPI003F88BBDC